MTKARAILFTLGLSFLLFSSCGVIKWPREAKIYSEPTACKASLKGVETALDFFYNENDRYVTTEEGLKELVKLGKLKKGQIKDPWKNPWDYKAVKSAGSIKAQRYYLRSIGPDGKRNTKDDINSDNYPWPKEGDGSE